MTNETVEVQMNFKLKSEFNFRLKCVSGGKTGYRSNSVIEAEAIFRVGKLYCFVQKQL